MSLPFWDERSLKVRNSGRIHFSNWFERFQRSGHALHAAGLRSFVPCSGERRTPESIQELRTHHVRIRLSLSQHDSTDAVLTLHSQKINLTEPQGE